jgi:hypothetical protein
MIKRMSADERARILGRVATGDVRMLLRGNISRRRRATCPALTASLGVLLWAAAPAAQGSDPPLPEARAVVAAYQTLRGWTDAFDLPAPDEAGARFAIEGATGACVALRRSGRLIGVGVDAGGTDRMLRRAAARAFGAVLGDHSVARLPDEIRATVGTTLTVELEVAGAPAPLPGRTWAQIAAQLEPGLDGVAMRRRDTWVMRFPVQLRATDRAGDLQGVLPALAAELGLPARDLQDLLRGGDVGVYRFRTTHLVQREPGAMPVSTYRGDTLVALSSVTRDRIAAFADGIAAHLMARRWPEPADAQQARRHLGIMGDYRPLTDEHRPRIAPPMEQGLAALALARYAAAPEVSETAASSARAAARRILEDLAIVEQGEVDPLVDPAACAVIILAAREIDDTVSELRSEALVKVHRAVDDGMALSPHVRSLVAAALASALSPSSTRIEIARARGALDAAWSGIDRGGTVGLLPWIGWGELDFAAALERPVANADRLVRLRDQLDRARIGPGQDALDLQGAFLLTVPGPTGISRATAQTIRPAAFHATMLRSPLTDAATAPAAMGRHLQTMRYLIQLSYRADGTLPARNRARAAGGIRQATWDSRQPVAAQALGLITAAETLLSLEALSGAPEAPQADF